MNCPDDLCQMIEEKIFLYVLMAEIELTVEQERGYCGQLDEMWGARGMTPEEIEETRLLLFADGLTSH